MATTLEKLTTLASAADALGAKVKIAFKGGGNILIDGTGEDNVVSAEDAEVETILHMEESDLAAILDGDLNPMSAFMEGKLKIEGDMGTAMKMSSLFG